MGAVNSSGGRGPDASPYRHEFASQCDPIGQEPTDAHAGQRMPFSLPHDDHEAPQVGCLERNIGPKTPAKCICVPSAIRPETPPLDAPFAVR